MSASVGLTPKELADLKHVCDFQHHKEGETGSRLIQVAAAIVSLIVFYFIQGPLGLGAAFATFVFGGNFVAEVYHRWRDQRYLYVKEDLDRTTFQQYLAQKKNETPDTWFQNILQYHEEFKRNAVAEAERLMASH